MVSKKNLFKKFGSNGETILGSVALIVLIYAIYKYSNTKNTTISNMNAFDIPLKTTQGVVRDSTKTIKKSIGKAAETIEGVAGEMSSSPYSVSSNSTDLDGTSSQEVSSLLPNSNNNGTMQMIEATFSKGVRELYKLQPPLRNANLQLRQDIFIPVSNTGCLWNQSTIEPTTNNQVITNL